MHPLVAFARLARVPRMHMQAIGAAIDLRGTDLDEFHQRMLEPAFIHVILEAENGVIGIGRGLVAVETFFHGECSIFHEGGPA